MKDKKSNRKSGKSVQDDLLKSISAVSATEQTGMIPALSESQLEEANEAYSELGISGMAAMPDEEDYSQGKMPQI